MSQYVILLAICRSTYSSEDIVRRAVWLGRLTLETISRVTNDQLKRVRNPLRALKVPVRRKRPNTTSRIPERIWTVGRKRRNLAKAFRKASRARATMDISAAIKAINSVCFPPVFTTTQK